MAARGIVTVRQGWSMPLRLESICLGDRNLPSWIPSTVHYARWGWRELEPEKGKIAYDMLDRVLKETREAGQKTPLLMLVNGEECLTYATQHGTGWRGDCLGDLGFLRKWSHMEQGYPTWIREAGIQETWQTAPVAWETGGAMRHWVAVGSSLRHILNHALALHGSYINNKSAPLPSAEDIRSELERFLRRLGYRLVLKELKHLGESDDLPIHAVIRHRLADRPVPDRILLVIELLARIDGISERMIPIAHFDDLGVGPVHQQRLSACSTHMEPARRSELA